MIYIKLAPSVVDALGYFFFKSPSVLFDTSRKKNAAETRSTQELQNVAHLLSLLQDIPE